MRFGATALAAFAVTAFVSTSLGALPGSDNTGLIRRTPEEDIQLEKRIIGGSPAPAGKYTFAVRLTITEGTEQFLCGGSLIADNLVVTAAHCLVDSNTNTVVSARSVVVSYGSYDNSAQKYVIATNLTVNPNYDARAITNDIALIQIPKLTLSSSVSTIPIYTGSLPSNTTLTTMGWGKTNSSNDNSLSKTLLAVDVKIGDKSSCRVVDPTYQSADGPQVCTVNALTPGKDSCQGDSGSPTIISQNGVPYLAALTSVGTDPANPGAEDCAMPKGVALYTHVNYFMSFITSTTGRKATEFTSSSSSSSSSSNSSSSSSSSNSSKTNAAAAVLGKTGSWNSSLLAAAIAVAAGAFVM